MISQDKKTLELTKFIRLHTHKYQKNREFC